MTVRPRLLDNSAKVAEPYYQIRTDQQWLGSKIFQTCNTIATDKTIVNPSVKDCAIDSVGIMWKHKSCIPFREITIQPTVQRNRLF